VTQMTMGDTPVFSVEEQQALRRAWVDQLSSEAARRSPQEAVKLIAHRTAGAPDFIGLERYRSRARLLQERPPQGEELAAVLTEVRGWIDEVGAAASHAEAAITEDAKVPAVEALRVLVVDDDPVQRALIGRKLGKLGHEVTFAENGRQGIKLGLTHTFDAILMDRILPDLEGPRVLMVLRAKGVTAPAALLTASASEVGDVLGAAGISMVLHKPVGGEQLQAALAELVH
jgi:CheY-like chemotaxis protein